MHDPTNIGAYEILAFIGQGGMGAVYRAQHCNAQIRVRQGGVVAIKVMHQEYTRDPRFRQRFTREAELCLMLDHPNIVKVHDLVVDGPHMGIVMELVEGESLESMIGERTGPLPWERAWPLFRQLLDAVGAAHDRQVVHRDLKPANIMVTADRQIKVLDFGIAKQADSNLTATGSRFGTVAYMAPEQYMDASRTDHRADIYALGMTLYEMLAGRLPWEPGTTEFHVQTVKAQGKLPPPTDYYPRIPRAAVEAIQCALSLRIEDRFPTVRAFSEALGPSAPSPRAERPTQPPESPPGPRSPRESAARPRSSSGMAKLAAACSVFSLLLLLPLGLWLLCLTVSAGSLGDDLRLAERRIERLQDQAHSAEEQALSTPRFARYRIPPGKSAAETCHDHGKPCWFVPSESGQVGDGTVLHVWDCTSRVEESSACSSGYRMYRGTRLFPGSTKPDSGGYCTTEQGWEWVYCLEE